MINRSFPGRAQSSQPLRIVAISDTHGAHREVLLADGDVLVHAGDITMDGEASVIEDFINWFSAQPFQHKIFIAGNHDHWAEKEPLKLQALAQEAGVHYLCNNGVVVEGVQFWGSPYTPEFMNWSFMLAAGSTTQHWQQVPDNIDVLVTHGPPYSVLDEVTSPATATAQATEEDSHVGCTGLLQRVSQLGVPVHIFGHIHEGFGTHVIDQTRFFNVSQLDHHYQLANSPVVIDFKRNYVSMEDAGGNVVIEAGAGVLEV